MVERLVAQLAPRGLDRLRPVRKALLAGGPHRSREDEDLSGQR